MWVLNAADELIFEWNAGKPAASGTKKSRKSEKPRKKSRKSEKSHKRTSSGSSAVVETPLNVRRLSKGQLI